MNDKEMKIGEKKFSDFVKITGLKATRPDMFIFTNDNKNMKIIAPCVHLNRLTNKCGIYEDRPITCREYCCSKCDEEL